MYSVHVHLCLPLFKPLLIFVKFLLVIVLCDTRFSSLATIIHDILLYNVLLLSELYENLEKVGSSVKHHIVEGMRNMWNQLNELARAHSSVATPKEEEQEIAQCEHND